MDIAPPLEPVPGPSVGPEQTVDQLTGEIVTPDDAQLAHIKALLDTWADLQAGYDYLRAQALNKVQPELDVLDAEFKPKLDALAASIRSNVVAHGASVNVPGASATFVKGGYKVNTDRLLGYAAAHPEVMQFVSTSAPSVRVTWKGVQNV